jgi:hypothetical protein
MKKNLFPAVLAALVLATAAAPASEASAPEGATRRLALVIGSHDGGKGRERLMYAGSDAHAFRRTLEELGGLTGGDATLLIDPDSLRVLRALDDMEDRTRALKRAGMRVEAMVYYSGHADEKGLRLGSQGMDYRVFRSRLNALGADVRIAVVDACESGALTRMKGGRNAPAFLVDQSTRSEGYAILTSSSENEAAQESDRVGGSFFTHALNSGLRGAADASRDGRVTLHEAYQFAYNETLARTQATRGGPQHAGYDIQLSGSGDVVLTDLRQASAFLDLSKDLQGRLFIRDSAEHLAAELQKPAGGDMRIGLSPGTYGLRLLQGPRWSEASVTLEEGKAARVTPGVFRTVGSEATVSRGGDSVEQVSVEDTGFHHVPPNGSGGFSTALLYDVQREEWHGTQLAPLVTDARTHLRGGQLTIGVNVTRGDLEGYQAAVGLNATGGSLHGFQLAELNIVSGHLEGAQVAPVANIAGDHATGLQLSGVFNVAGGGLKGWQGAGVFSISGGETRGGQISAVFDITADSLRGGQGAGVFNITGRKVMGGQGAGVFNIAGGEVKGGQGAGIFNMAGGDVTGGQGAGIFNAAWGDVTGAQGAGIFNAARGDVKGAQGAGIFNFSADDVHGVQAAGILNASKGLRGFQVAPILNVTGRANGYQIGLINLSDDYESGVPIGLINISRRGSFEAESWVEETGFVFTGLRTGANWMHSHFAVGVKPRGDQRMLAPTLGMSGEYAFKGTPLFWENGLMYSTLFALKKYSLDDGSIESDWARLRTGLGIKPVSFITIVGGLSYNVIVHPYSDIPLTGNQYRYFRTYGDVVSMWPGAWAGIRIGK